MKKIGSLLLAFTILLALTACGGEKTPPAAVGNGGDGGTGAAPAYSSGADLLSWSWEDIEAAAKQEGELTFAVWNNEAEWNQVADAFKARYGVKVNVLAGEKTTVMDKVLTELDGKASIDVMFLSGETVNGLLGADALLPGILDVMEYKDSLVPGLSVRKEGVSNDQGWWVPVSTSPAGFLYNADQISGDALPQTFQELEAFINENPGRFAMCIPENGGTGQGVMESIIANLTGGLDQYLLAEDGVCDPALLEKWSAVWDWFNLYKDKITFTTSNGDGISRLNSGEVWLVTAWNSDIYNAASQGNLSITHGFYVPEMGLCYSGEVMSLAKNASHPAAALLFTNWLTSEEGQTAQADYTKNMTGRTDLEQGICLLTPEDRARNTDWMAACYKTQYIRDFTTNVLQ